jgi:hypothetical protein
MDVPMGGLQPAGTTTGPGNGATEPGGCASRTFRY